MHEGADLLTDVFGIVMDAEALVGRSWTKAELRHPSKNKGNKDDKDNNGKDKEDKEDEEDEEEA